MAATVVRVQVQVPAKGKAFLDVTWTGVSTVTGLRSAVEHRFGLNTLEAADLDFYSVSKADADILAADTRAKARSKAALPLHGALNLAALDGRCIVAETFAERRPGACSADVLSCASPVRAS